MVEHTRETPNTMSLQAGPMEVCNGTPSHVNTRDVQNIGRQLAQIGDELNQRWAHRLPNQWLQPVNGRTNIFIRASVYRCIVSEGRRLRDFFALGNLRLNPLVYNQPAWVSSVCPAGLGWTTGLLASTALLATAAVCLALWVQRTD
ncbi:bcl-2-interacting killer [Clupea harengus]|uniref:Bcl-2-interacting killer n=1 Tax=Clupea harengus TaxID=7950 RepID=A0A8M1KPZ5_CLUHA|nr:bcl-2-interacting killer [Clupea harengus]